MNELPNPTAGIKTGNGLVYFGVRRRRDISDWLLPMLVGGGVLLSMLLIAVAGLGLVWLGVFIATDIARRLVG